MADSALRQAIIARLGAFPSKPPLQLEFGVTVDQGDHRRTLVSYAVELDERVSAWLLQPPGAAPTGGWPGILAIHQHAGQFELGKSEPAGLIGDPTYFYGLELCRRGYVVLCPDQLCFEDRRPSAEVRQNNPMLEGTSYERFEFMRRVVHGSSLQTKYLHDMECALDVLEGIDGVDAARLGVIGHSLGGQETLWLTWYDSRVRAAVSSCGFSLIDAIIRDGINHNYALYVPDLLNVCDMDALVADLAPRPFLFTAGEADSIFPIDAVQAITARAAAAYAQAGHPERFQALIFPGGHSFPAGIKAAAYAFLDRWLA